MKYIFFDIDGTLLDSEKGINPSTVEALKKARAKGHKVFINTGRSYAELGTGFEQFEFDGVVCAAGAYIKIGDQVIFDKYIGEKEVDEIISILEELKIEYALEGIEFTYFTEPVYQGFRDRVYKAIEGILDVEPNGYEPYHFMLQPAFVRKVEDYYEEKTIIQKFLLYSRNIESNYELANKLSDDYALIIYDTFAELIHKGINKATGIDRVMEYYGANIKDSIAIGDSLNDLDMLREAGIGIAMGNAPDEVKEHADIVAPHILDDGIYKVLEELKVI